MTLQCYYVVSCIIIPDAKATPLHTVRTTYAHANDCAMCTALHNTIIRT